MKMPSKHIFRLLAFGAMALLMAACSTTRRIPEGEQLYVGLKDVDIHAPEGQKVPRGVSSQIEEAVAVPPNNAIFKSPKYRWPFPLGLWVYNNWNNPPKGLKHKLYEKLVAEPVLVSDVRPELRSKMIDETLDNNGYFRGNATYEVLTQKNPKKAKIRYNVSTGPAFTLNRIELLPDTSVLNHMIDSLARREPYLQTGERYSTDSLSAVRIRITNKLRNRGYYFFRPDFIEYLADSVASPLKIDLRMMLAGNIAAPLLARYKVGDVTMIAYRNKGGGTPDHHRHTTRHTDSDAALAPAPPAHAGMRHLPQRPVLLRTRHEQHPDTPVASRHIQRHQHRGHARLGLHSRPYPQRIDFMHIRHPA